MPVIQPVVDLIDILVQHGLSHAVIAPGSRSAALTLALARHPDVRTIVSIDERTAGYLALGLAHQLQRPVAVVCTSGTAALNLAPAAAEAYFSQIPLLMLTADRPAEWIHQQDGQTIYQRDLYGKHVKKAWELPTDTTHPDVQWHVNRLANEAYLTAIVQPMGPVHLNVPIREPFYPSENEKFSPNTQNRLIVDLKAETTLSTADWHALQDAWEDSDKILIAAGQNDYNEALVQCLIRITEEWEIPVFGDVTANLGNHPDFISMLDITLQPERFEKLRPDLLVTYGQSFLSKKFRNFIREFPPRAHWHIGASNHLIDSLQSLTLRIPVEPAFFFKKMLEDIDFKCFVENREIADSTYKTEWLNADWLAARIVNEQISANLTSLDDLTSVKELVFKLPEEVLVHLGNSMPVRYANLLRRLGLKQRVWANRGTSGIDGCVSTAIGAALASESPVYLIVGDVSFLYDRNGFLLADFPQNLKIMILNNGGGNIFRIIDGPNRQPELETFFETKHTFTARATASDAGLAYWEVRNRDQLPMVMDEFIAHEGAAILEVYTDPNVNKKILLEIQKAFRVQNRAN